MINTSQQVGGSLGTALLNTIAATAATSYMKANTSTSPLFGLTHGFTVAFKVSAGLLIVGAVVLALFIKIGKESVVESEGGAVVH